MKLQTLNYKINSYILCAGTAVCVAHSLFYPPQVRAAADSKTAASTAQDQHQEMLGKIADLIKQYYPRVKTTQDKQKLHVEYKVHTYQNLYSGKAELAPDVGGILGDLEFKPGAYKGSDKLPKTQNQYSYLVLSMAPYLVKSDEHLKARLCYAPDAPVDFVTQFNDLLNEFDSKQAAVTTEPPVSPKSAPATQSPIASAVTSPDSAPKLTEPSNVASTPAAVTPADQKPGRKIFFWKATRGKEVVYLLGTVHVATTNFYPLAPEIDDAFDQSKELAVEVAIDRHSPDQKMIHSLVQDFGTYKSPDKLSKHLSPDTKKVLEDYLKWAGETIELYEQYKPWYVTNLIAASAPRRGEILSMKTGLGLDRYLLGRAKEQGKKVVELETLDSQLHLHSSLAEDVQDKLLQVSLLEYKDSLNEMKGIFEVWLAGDTEKLDRIVNRTVIAHPDLAPYNKILLDHRNVGMVNKTDQMSKLSSGPIFIAVGSAHLLGDTGLVTGLKNRGFDVQQVYSKGSVVHPDDPEVKVFGTDRFKVWLPKDPETMPNSYATVHEVADGPDKLYMINTVDFGGDQKKWVVPGPLALDHFLAILTAKLNAVVTSRHSMTVQDCAGRQIDFAIKAPPPVKPGVKPNDPGEIFLTKKSPAWFNGKFGQARAYLVGTKMYVQLVCGNKQFVDSPEVARFMNSIKFIR